MSGNIHANANYDTDLGTLITLSSASAGATGTVMDGSMGRGVIVFVNVSAISGTSPTLTVTINGVDSNGTAYAILASPTITTTGLTVLKIYPALTASANAVANDILPVNWRIDTAIGGTTPSVSAKISANLLF